MFSFGNYIFEHIWNFVVHNFKSHERDFLRALHDEYALFNLAKSLNRYLSPHQRIVSMTSIWVDGRPQCYMKPGSPHWQKPSCELADLLIVLWDNEKFESGTALLVQAKMAKKPIYLNTNDPSTRKEIYLLESGQDFFLSSDNKKTPVPFQNGINNVFSLPQSLGFCTYLNICEPSKSLTRMLLPKSWQIGSRWSAYWPSNGKQRHSSYFSTLLDMVTPGSHNVGEPFNFLNPTTDWDRLITALIKVTAYKSGKASAGDLQKKVTLKWHPDFLMFANHEPKNFNKFVPPLQGNDGYAPDAGIPILFITSHPTRSD